MFGVDGGVENIVFVISDTNFFVGRNERRESAAVRFQFGRYVI